MRAGGDEMAIFTSRCHKPLLPGAGNQGWDRIDGDADGSKRYIVA
jgi:hypothetical protein